MLQKILRKYVLVIVLAIQIAITIFYSANLSSVKYSYIGDEFNFYYYAKAIAIHEITPNPFSLNGVFHEHPVLGSYYQAVIMNILGTDIYGWKLSSIILIFPIGLLMFLLVKRLGNLPTAFFALIATDFSFYFYNFFQIGYLNNLSLLCLVFIMYLVTFIDTGKKKQSYVPYVLLGIVTGISWYFYIGKLFVAVLSIYLFLINKCTLRHWRSYVTFLLPALFLIALSFINTTGGSNLGITKTVMHKEFTDNAIVVKNILYPWILQFYSPIQTHYLSRGSYVDTITASLTTIGILLLAFSLFSKKFRMYQAFHPFLLFFFLISLSVEITIPYSDPPVTRGIHFVPFYILFASYCLLYITSIVKKQTFFVSLIFIIFTGGVVILNLLEINKPLPMNTNQKLFSDIKNEKPTDITLVKTKNCINLVNLDTAIKSYNLSQNTKVISQREKVSCTKSQIILTCLKDVCNTKPEKIYEKRLFLYRL